MHEAFINFDEIRYAWEYKNKYVLFNSSKKEEEIKKEYPTIKRIDISEEYSSDMVGKISSEKLKDIIVKSGFLENKQ